MNPAFWLARTAKLVPNAPALLTGTHVDADYAGFARRAASIAAGLKARYKVSAGDRVALFMTNRREYLEAMYGIWFLGAAAVPINAKLHPREAAWIVENAGAAVAFISADVGDALRNLAPSCLTAMIDVATPDYAALLAHDGLDTPVSMANGDLAWLFYTSGTTGRPKGVMITAGNIGAVVPTYFVDVDAVHPGDAALYAAPISHGAGLYNFMHVVRGARHVIPESGGFDPDEILNLAPRLRDVSMFMAPTMVRRLIDAARARGADGEGLRTIVYGGGPMYLADIIEAVEVMGPRFVQIYGQGESPMTITALARHLVADRLHPRWRERLASVGTAQSSVEVRITDEEGRDVPAGETGEIIVRGTPVMAGYWQNPEATAQTLRKGWLWTGDRGRMDADGFVTLIDRSKDVIISGGSNIYPREVEEVLLQHPDVHEVAVIGRKHPEWGEEVVAFVVAVPGREIDKTALDALCLDAIARFKRPKDYLIVEALPKNNYGKVLKTELREILAKS